MSTPASMPARIVDTRAEAAHEITATYKQLAEHHCANLKKGDAENHRSALKEWLSHKGLTPESVVGGEFGDHFESELGTHLQYLRTKPHRRKGKVVRGLDERTVGNKERMLRNWRGALAELIAAGVEKAEAAHFPKNIPEALRHLVKRKGVTPHRFAREAVVCPSNFRNWHSGRTNPSAGEKTVEAFKKIERFCELDDGKLTSLIRPTFKRRPEGEVDDVPRSAFARRQRTSVHEKYKLYDFPPALKAEWDELKALMTTALEPDGLIKRNGYWFVDPETGKCPTAGKNMNTLASFFGYLSLPVEGRRFYLPERKGKEGGKKAEGEKPAEPEFTVVKGKGFSEDCLTLALMTDVPLLKSYIEFVKGRAGGVYNTETEQIINLCNMLLRKGTGFVRQHPEYGARLQPPVPAEEWDARCEDAHQRFRFQLNQLKKNSQIVQSRDIEEPIDFILKDRYPIRHLYRLADLMEADMPEPTAGVLRAVAFRDMFLVRFLTANPLRIKHFSLVIWRADNTGNLYQEADGSWWLRFPKDAFKNRRRLKKSNPNRKYVAPLPCSLWPYVEEYLFKHRPLLLGADDCDFVFRPGLTGGSVTERGSNTEPMCEDSLSKTLRDNAREYLRCIGFGAHAYRHIIATDYMKNHPGGVMVAASILHDTPEMILKCYGHLQHADFFRHWLVYHEGQLEAVRAGRTQEDMREAA